MKSKFWDIQQNKIQIFQNMVLRDIVDVPWYDRNDIPHRHLKMPIVKKEIKRLARKQVGRLHFHTVPSYINKTN